MKAPQPRPESPDIKVYTKEEMEAEVVLHLRVLGACIKGRRKARGFSQKTLATRSHVSRGEIQHNEHGRHGMTEGTKKRICMAMGISIMELDAEVDRVEHEWKAEGRDKKK